MFLSVSVLLPFFVILFFGYWRPLRLCLPGGPPGGAPSASFFSSGRRAKRQRMKKHRGSPMLLPSGAHQSSSL